MVPDVFTCIHWMHVFHNCILFFKKFTGWVPHEPCWWLMSTKQNHSMYTKHEGDTFFFQQNLRKSKYDWASLAQVCCKLAPLGVLVWVKLAPWGVLVWVKLAPLGVLVWVKLALVEMLQFIFNLNLKGPFQTGTKLAQTGVQVCTKLAHLGVQVCIKLSQNLHP